MIHVPLCWIFFTSGKLSPNLLSEVVSSLHPQVFGIVKWRCLTVRRQEILIVLRKGSHQIVGAIFLHAIGKGLDAQVIQMHSANGGDCCCLRMHECARVCIFPR